MFILTAIFGFIKAISGFATEYIRTKGNVEIVRIKTDAINRQTAASVVKEGMQHKVFWIPWLMAAIPTAGWYGWGMMDSMLYNGTLLPDVAALPPQLLHYADIVMGNLFYSGAAVAGVQGIGTTVSRVVTNWKGGRK